MSEELQVAEAAPATETISESPAQTEVLSPEARQDSFNRSFEKVHDKIRPSRAPSGQFSRKPSEHELIGLTDHSAHETLPSEAETKSTQQPAGEIKPPATLNAKAREQWNSLPRDMQEYIAQRESEAQNKITEQGRALKATESIRPHLQHVERLARESGLTTGDAIQRFIAADQFIKTNPEGAIRYLAQAHNVDLGKFAGDPRQQQAREMQMAQQAWEWANQQIEAQRSESEKKLAAHLEKFVESKGEAWGPEIEASLLHHIPGIKAADPELTPREVFKMAYERALKENPDRDPSTKTKAEQAKAEAKKKADEAKRLASLNVKSSVGRTPRVSKNIWADMEDVYDRISGR